MIPTTDALAGVADIGPSPSPATEAVAQPETAPVLLWGSASLQAGAPTDKSWLWHGYLAPGALTLLTSQWKSGKTTLISVLLARLKTGGEFAGLPLAAGKAVVISEEPRQLWEIRGRRLDFADHVGWFCRPFPGKPSAPAWRSLVERIAGLRAERGVSLAVIDPLAAFLPGKSENDAPSMLEALAPLQRLTSLGMAVLVLHHPRKQESAPGTAPRGSGALLGHADILIEMRACPRAADGDRRRRLHAFSRYDETPRERLIELSSDGLDYSCLGTFEQGEFAADWEILRGILAAASRKLTCPEILRSWPATRSADRASIYRWLNRAVDLGFACRDGRGRRRHPFRYWLTGQEDRWRTNPASFLPLAESAQQEAPLTPSPLRGEGRGEG
jgi:hypothetical protein